MANSASADVDLVCVGGGLAGLTAANRAAQSGARVLVLEQGTDELYACNSRFAGGVMHISYENPKGSLDTLEGAIATLSCGYADPALVRALTGNAARAIDWLRAEGVLFARAGSIGWRQWIMAPMRPPVTQMEWKGRGADATLRVLERNLVRRKGELRRGARALRLVMEGGRCTGVVARTGDSDAEIRARHVLLADGGFQGDADMLSRHVTRSPAALKQRGAGTGLGDALRMAVEVGAAHTELDAFYGHILSRDAMYNDSVWPYPQLDELAAAGLLVDAHGQRFADEGFGGVYMANAIARQADPLGTFVVFDDAIWNGPGRSPTVPPNPLLVKAGGTLHTAATLDALAAKAGIDAAALERTVDVYNASLATDASPPLTPTRSTHRRQPQPLVAPPFHAAPSCAGVTYTMGGLRIDAGARVLDSAHRAIDGLLAAGACTGGLEGGPAVGYVGGLMKAAVFGLLAGEHVAQAATRAGA